MYPINASSLYTTFPTGLNRPATQPPATDNSQQNDNNPPLHAAHHTMSERIHDKVVALGDDVGVGISKVFGIGGHEPIEVGLEAVQENAVHFLA